MAFDEGLAHRLREFTENEPLITEKKMFGGLCFLVSGNMCFGIVGDELMVRVGAAAYQDCLAMPNAREMDFTGRAMKGMIYVSPEGFEEDEDLENWIGYGIDFAGSLLPKTAAKQAATRAAKKPSKRPSKKSVQKPKKSKK